MYAIPGRVALVTAASSGIGLACARALARAGARVAINSRDPERLAAAARQVAESAGRPVLAVPGDLTDPEVPFRITARSRANSARSSCWSPTSAAPAGHLRRARRAGLARRDRQRPVAGDPALARGPARMRNLRFGRIVHVLSLTARQPLGGLATSNTLRPAVAGLIGDLARDNAVHGITVNAVCPA